MTKILIEEAVVRQALEALENHPGNYKLSKAECAEYRAVEDALRQALEQAALHKLAADSTTEGLSLDDWNKIGCVNHDCDKCKALAEQPAPAQPLTDADYYNACLSYRHDFGLMSDEDSKKLVFQAKEWARAFGITKGNT